MTYEQIKNLKESQFKHLCGVKPKPELFEDKLIQSNKFGLPGKKALLDNEIEWSMVIIDVGETPIEKPKKRYDPAAVSAARERAPR